MKKLITLALALLLTAAFCVSAGAEIIGGFSGDKVFSDEAKLINFAPGENIFKLNTPEGMTAKDFADSGNAQFTWQHNNNKWGRANYSSINGMALVGDGLWDLAPDKSGAGGCYYAIKNDYSLFDADATANNATGKYHALIGWAFAKEFTVDSFKMFISGDPRVQNLESFDILVGNDSADGNSIEWTVAYSAEHIITENKCVRVMGSEYPIDVIAAKFPSVIGKYVEIGVTELNPYTMSALQDKYFGREIYITEFELYSAGGNPDLDVQGAVTEAYETTAETEPETTPEETSGIEDETSADDTTPEDTTVDAPSGDTTKTPDTAKPSDTSKTVTTAPEKEEKKGGCGSVSLLAVVVAAVAVIPAVVIKKKH